MSKWVEKKVFLKRKGGGDSCADVICQELPHAPPFIQFALSAAEQALTDAKWKPQSQLDKERTVCRFSLQDEL